VPLPAADAEGPHQVRSAVQRTLRPGQGTKGSRREAAGHRPSPRRPCGCPADRGREESAAGRSAEDPPPPVSPPLPPPPPPHLPGHVEHHRDGVGGGSCGRAGTRPDRHGRRGEGGARRGSLPVRRCPRRFPARAGGPRQGLPDRQGPTRGEAGCRQASGGPRRGAEEAPRQVRGVAGRAAEQDRGLADSTGQDSGRVVHRARGAARRHPEEPGAGTADPFFRTQGAQALKGPDLMERVGKILVFVYTTLAVSPAAWALALWGNRVDWTDRKATADKPAGLLAERRAEYERSATTSLRPADRRLRDNRDAVAYHEGWRAYERNWYERELKFLQNGDVKERQV